MTHEKKPRCVIFGATGRIGRILVSRFMEMGWYVVAVGRNENKLYGLGHETVRLDLNSANNDKTSHLIKNNDLVVLAAGAKFVSPVLSLCPPDIKRLIVLGSTRYLSAYPGVGGIAVRSAIDLLQNQEQHWTMLAPTMIYGGQGENNVKRMEKLISRFGLVPLPGGGKNLLQPIHVLDVVEAIICSARIGSANSGVIHIAGPKAITNKYFLEQIAKAVGKSVKVLNFPKPLMIALAFISRFVPRIPTITGDEVERLLEDRSVDISDMKNLLGVTSRDLEEGLTETFSGKI